MSPQSASGLHCNYITAEFEHKNRILGTCNRTVLSVTVQEQIVKRCAMQTIRDLILFCELPLR